jgi:hypothetical protein
MSQKSAQVEVLTAEVRALMIGSRQVTLSVYRQLDEVKPQNCEPFGRVRDTKDEPKSAIFVVGRDATGSLVRSLVWKPRPPDYATDPPVPFKNWARFTSDGPEVAIKIDRYPRLAAQVLIDGEDQVVWRVDEHVYHGPLPPGRWEYRSPEHAAWALSAAQAEVAALRETRALYEKWSALPLIVLAGLK